MSAFKDMVAADNLAVFLNDGEFADRRTVRYDGAVYADIPIVLSGIKQSDRPVMVSSGDHGQGLYLASAVLHCALSDLGGNQPERVCASRSTTRRAAVDSTANTTSPLRTAKWGCCGWNWRRSTNEHCPYQRSKRQYRRARQ